MTAAFRVLQLVVTYTYITGSDKSAIKCRVLFSRFLRFKKCVMNFSKKEKRKQGRKREEENERKREKKGKGRENCSVISFGQGKETEFLTYRKIPKSNMWLEQSRVKVTFMQKISRMTTSLTVTELKLETESHADEQTFRITRDARFTFFGHKLKLGV